MAFDAAVVTRALVQAYHISMVPALVAGLVTSWLHPEPNFLTFILLGPVITISSAYEILRMRMLFRNCSHNENNPQAPTYTPVPTSALEDGASPSAGETAVSAPRKRTGIAHPSRSFIYFIAGCLLNMHCAPYLCPSGTSGSQDIPTPLPILEDYPALRYEYIAARILENSGAVAFLIDLMARRSKATRWLYEDDVRMGRAKRRAEGIELEEQPQDGEAGDSSLYGMLGKLMPSTASVHITRPTVSALNGVPYRRGAA